MRRLLEGKVVDVERRVTDGFVRGAAVIEGLRDDAGRLLRLEIQNENLVAMEDGVVRGDGPGHHRRARQPHRGAGVHTERLRYGQRVTAIAFPCNPIWRTTAGTGAGRAAGIRIPVRLCAHRGAGVSRAPGSAHRDRRRRHQHRRGHSGLVGPTAGQDQAARPLPTLPAASPMPWTRSSRRPASTGRGSRTSCSAPRTPPTR